MDSNSVDDSSATDDNDTPVQGPVNDTPTPESEEDGDNTVLTNEIDYDTGGPMGNMEIEGRPRWYDKIFTKIFLSLKEK